MIIANVSTLFRSEQARAEISSIQQQLFTAERQLASGRKVEDFADAGATAGGVLSARQQLANLEARRASFAELDTRFSIQDLSLGRAGDAVAGLRQEILNIVATGDGRQFDRLLQDAVRELASALNATSNGLSLFAGERVEEAPIAVTSVADLAALPDVWDAFNESARSETFSPTAGVQVELAPRASQFAASAFEAIRDLVAIAGGAGASLPSPITQTQQEQLILAADALYAAHGEVLAAQAANGDLWRRTDEEGVRLGAQADTLAKALGDQVDADLAEVATRLAQLQTQFQASAQTFAQLRNLTLLNFLR